MTRLTIFAGRRAGRNYIMDFMEGLKTMSNITNIEDYQEMNEHINTVLIQEMFEILAEHFIETEGINLSDSQLELLNNLIEVLFFE